MSCQRVMSMLSAYIDGEAQTTDAMMVKQHLETCASCAHELEMLHRTSQMLADVDELAPPAFLLEQIEAATVNRPSVAKRVQSAFQFPLNGFGRWAATGAAAVGIIIAMLAFQPDMKQTVQAPAISPDSSPSVAVTVEPIETEMLVEEIAADTVIPVTGVVEASPRRVRTVSTTVDRTPQVTRPVSGQPRMVVSDKPKQVAAEPDTKVETAVEIEITETAALVAHVMETADSMLDSNVIVEKPAATETRVRVASTTASDLDEKLRQQTDILEGLRSRITAKNNQRKYESNLERIEGRKHSVELASVRF